MGKHRAKARGFGPRIGGLLLSVAAIIGFLAVVLAVLAFTFNYRIILFSTGSMSPTIPAGSAALTREVPASQVKVGDIATVQREGKLPVTHRVRSIGEADGETREIIMRGDANDFDDATPYRVQKVSIVIFSVPGVAKVFVWLGQPWVMFTVTGLAGALILWAFWPRKSARSEVAETA